ncbi:Hypothetical predicted protein [Pelobates cultripes]|uniref:Uncharacterized protein n=1 Tax=Pelobates cultripes TaxID=61616 RepID=A0AAD1RSI1_PELCU|nr:Hypothetical predicted protein [Pelobates cultripes]
MPLLTKRLLQAALPSKPAKGLTLDSLFRIPRRPRNAPDSARDVIMSFKSRSDKDGFLRAVRGQTPYAFEDLTLYFYQDLSRKMLQWHASLKETTTQLRAADIQYKWGYPRMLIATQEGQSHRLTTPAEAPKFLQALGIRPVADAKTSTPHRWDVANIAPFTPSGQAAPAGSSTMHPPGS